MTVGELSLEEFKARLPLAEIVGRYVKLTRRGREQLGLCPFHQEKTPSFNVVEDKGFYHCFGCGAHGTAIDFVMAIEGLDFPEALERLADLTGIAAPRRAQRSRPEPDQRLYAANAAAAAWFQAQLAGAAGKEATAYLERRGLGRETVRGFELGYAPNDGPRCGGRSLAQGFTPETLLAAGLLVQAEDGGEAYDRFRHRIMFPIADERGRIVGFGGRALGEARAKYLNTPETELFHKGELLYNLHRAAKPARERRAVVLAEGYMDVIALAQAGLAHAVAPLGTAVTERQLALLWRLAEAPIVCLDGDRAGLAAALRAAERALPLMRGGQTLRFAVLPDGEDPDSYLRRHGAGGAGRGVVQSPHSVANDLAARDAGPALRDARGARGAEPAAARARPARRRPRPAGEPAGPVPQPAAGAVAATAMAAARAETPGGEAFRVGGGGAVPARRRHLAAGDQPRGASACSRCCGTRNGWTVTRRTSALLQLTDPRLERLRQEIVAWFVEAGNLDADALQRHLLRYGFGPLLDQFAADLTPPTAPAHETDDAAHRQGWCDMLAATRHRAALDRERPTEDELRLGDEAEINRWFNTLDRLLNRDGADDAEADDESAGAPG